MKLTSYWLDTAVILLFFPFVLIQSERERKKINEIKVYPKVSEQIDVFQHALYYYKDRYNSFFFASIFMSFSQKV
jgi:hypothetical protein